MNNNKTLTVNEAIGREVQLWLKRGDLNQIEVASLLNLTQGTVSSKLRGRSPFSIQELLILSSALNITIADLLGDGILNARVPAADVISHSGDKKIAPIGFIPTGATYEVVGPAGLEPATKGL